MCHHHWTMHSNAISDVQWNYMCVGRSEINNSFTRTLLWCAFIYVFVLPMLFALAQTRTRQGCQHCIPSPLMWHKDVKTISSDVASSLYQLRQDPFSPIHAIVSRTGAISYAHTHRVGIAFVCRQLGIQKKKKIHVSLHAECLRPCLSLSFLASHTHEATLAAILHTITCCHTNSLFTS